jgi:hypothetical protein
MSHFKFSSLETKLTYNIIERLKFYDDFINEEYDILYKCYEAGNYEYNYEVKQIKVDHFLEAWKYVSTLKPKKRTLIIKSKYFKYLASCCDNSTISRKCDFKDEGFIQNFSYLIDMDIAKKYNSTFPKEEGSNHIINSDDEISKFKYF